MKFPEFDELGNMIGQGFDSGAQVLNNPGVQGLLAAGLGAASQVGKRNVGPLNTLGAAGLAGLGAYGLGRNVNSRNEYNKARIKALTQKQVMEADALKRGQTWLETNNKLEQEGIPIKQKMNEYNTQLINTPYSTPTPTQVPYELGEQDTYSSALGKAKDQRVVLDEYNQRKNQHLSSMDNPNLANFLKQDQTPLTSEAGMPQVEKLNNAISRLDPTDPNYRQNITNLKNAIGKGTGTAININRADRWKMEADEEGYLYQVNESGSKPVLDKNGKHMKRATASPFLQSQISAGRKIGSVYGEDISKAYMDLPQAANHVFTAARELRDLPNHAAFSSAVGFTWRPKAKLIDGTPEADFVAKVDQIMNGAFLDAFQALKGGGHITEIEGEKATRAKARLDTNLSEEGFKEAIQDYIEVIERGLEVQKQKALLVDVRMLGIDDSERFRASPMGRVDTTQPWDGMNPTAPATPAAKEEVLELPANPNFTNLIDGQPYNTKRGVGIWRKKNNAFTGK